LPTDNVMLHIISKVC